MVYLLSFLWGAFLVFITILALGNLLFPSKLWKPFDAWKARITPSPGYFFMQRVSGFVAFIFCIVLWYLFYLANFPS